MMTKVRGWRKKGSTRGKWSDARIIGVHHSRLDDVVGFSVSRAAPSWDETDSVVDIRMNAEQARNFAQTILSMLSLTPSSETQTKDKTS